MKLLIVTITIVLAFNASAAQAKEKRVDAKCFVDLYGGGQTIYYATVPEKKLSKLAGVALKQKAKGKGATSKQLIYKVHECVLASEDFSSAIARRLEASSPK